MHNKSLILCSFLIVSGSVFAEQDLIGGAGKQLLKQSASSVAPKEAVGTVEGVQAAGEKLEAASKLKEAVTSSPDALKDKAQGAVTDAAKDKLNEAVPEKAKESIKTVEKGAKIANNLKDAPKSSDAVTEVIKDKVKDKVKEEATKKALGAFK